MSIESENAFVSRVKEDQYEVLTIRLSALEDRVSKSQESLLILLQGIDDLLEHLLNRKAG